MPASISRSRPGNKMSARLIVILALAILAGFRPEVRSARAEIVPEVDYKYYHVEYDPQLSLH